MAHEHSAYRDVLARTDFFADAESSILDALAAVGSERQLVRGDMLFDEGDPPDALYVVTRGRVAIAIANPIDRRESVVALMEPGDLFGELGMLDDRPRSAMARALEPSSVLAVPYAPVLEMFDQQPRLLWNVTRLLAQRLRAMDEALADSVFLDVTGRTAKRLLELADGSDQFTLPVTQEELAGMVGASRERVNKAIASFIRLGWIEQRDRQYTITQRDRLELRARYDPPELTGTRHAGVSGRAVSDSAAAATRGSGRRRRRRRGGGGGGCWRRGRSRARPRGSGPRSRRRPAAPATSSGGV